MLAYGYSRNSETDYPESLSETTLLCTKEELVRIIGFLQDIQSKVTSYESVNGFHAHFRDYDPRWSTAHSDFIISLKDEK